jgi:hypothetical protein
MDMRTRKVTTLPGSEGLYSTRWSPDGRYIAAMPDDHLRLLVYDGKNPNRLGIGAHGFAFFLQS